MAIPKTDAAAMVKQLKTMYPKASKSPEVKVLYKYLQPGESILAMTTGINEGTKYLAAVVKTKIIFVAKKGRKQFDMPIKHVASVFVEPSGCLHFGQSNICFNVQGKNERILNAPRKEAEAFKAVVSSLACE